MKPIAVGSPTALPDHTESAEETFTVVMTATGDVRVQIRAFSRPASLLARAGGPLSRLIQEPSSPVAQEAGMQGSGGTAGRWASSRGPVRRPGESTAKSITAFMSSEQLP